MKKKMIWSYDTYNWDREEMIGLYKEIYDHSPSEEELYEFIEDENLRCLEDEQTNIEFYEKQYGTKHYIIIASLGLWNGRFDGGKIIKGLWNSISKCFEDYNEIYQDGKRVKVTAHHHDGTNYFEIRELTDKGIEYWERHEYDMSDRELHTRLFKDSHYSHEVSLFNELYGW